MNAIDHLCGVNVPEDQAPLRDAVLEAVRDLSARLDALEKRDAPRDDDQSGIYAESPPGDAALVEKMLDAFQNSGSHLAEPSMRAALAVAKDALLAPFTDEEVEAVYNAIPFNCYVSCDGVRAALTAFIEGRRK